MQLSTPLSIKGRIFPNRSAMSPMVPNCAGEDGSVSDEYRNFYVARAKAGVGYIVLGGVYVHRDGRGFPKQLGIYSDALKPGLSELVRAAGQHSRVGVQLSFKSLQKMPESFTLSEIEKYRAAFAEAAVRAEACGFDAVELHACHDYWLNYFLSPHFNHRNDEYGGSLENRFRLLREVFQEVKAAVRNSLILGVRLSMDEFMEDGLTLEETLQVSKWLEELGADYISASAGIGKTQYRMSPPMEVPRGSLLHLAKALKQTVSIPVIGVGRLDRPEIFRKAIEDGWADLAGVGRALIADPKYVTKTIEGRDRDIRPCLACNYCLVCLHRGENVQCAVNPLVGRDLLEVQPLKSPLKVVVVGGGPAGLSAAAAAAERGAGVTLVEKKKVTGGLLNVAKIPPHKEPIRELIDHLVERAIAAGVEIRTGHTVSAADVQALHPDRVIVATGSTSLSLRISGLENNERVVLCEDFLERGRIEDAAEYIVVGGGAAGLETAEYIAEGGGRVTVIEMTEYLGRGLHATRLHLTLKRLDELKARVLPNTKLQSVEGGLVHVETAAGLATLGPFDILVMAVGYRSEATLAADLDPALSCRIVGDALQPGSIYEAIKEGFDAALDLETLKV